MRILGNSRDDYYATRPKDFPILARLLLLVVATLVWLVTKILWPWKIENADELFKDGETGSVVIMNHVSILEPLLVVISYVFKGKRIRPIYKSEFDDIWILGAFLTWVGCIPINRGTADMKHIRFAQKALQAGDSILIYPEGTRVRSDDQPVEIHGGFTLIAHAANADIIPSAVVGARDIKPKGKLIPRPHRVWLRVGERIRLEKVERSERKRYLEQLESTCIEQMYAIRNELRLEHPGSS